MSEAFASADCFFLQAIDLLSKLSYHIATNWHCPASKKSVLCSDDFTSEGFKLCLDYLSLSPSHLQFSFLGEVRLKLVSPSRTLQTFPFVYYKK